MCGASSWTIAGVNHGFLLHNGVVTVLDFPAATLTQALGLNQVVWVYNDVKGNTHGLLADVKALQFLSVNDPRASIRRPSMGSMTAARLSVLRRSSNGQYGRFPRANRSVPRLRPDPIQFTERRDNLRGYPVSFFTADVQASLGIASLESVTHPQ
jgi:hypothetical protein